MDHWGESVLLFTMGFLVCTVIALCCSWQDIYNIFDIVLENMEIIEELDSLALGFLHWKTRQFKADYRMV